MLSAACMSDGGIGENGQRPFEIVRGHFSSCRKPVEAKKSPRSIVSNVAILVFVYRIHGLFRLVVCCASAETPNK
jgi:hypothetical protein